MSSKSYESRHVLLTQKGHPYKMLMAIDRYIAIHCNKYAIVPRNRPPKRAHLVAEKEINSLLKMIENIALRLIHLFSISSQVLSGSWRWSLLFQFGPTQSSTQKRSVATKIGECWMPPSLKFQKTSEISMTKCAWEAFIFRSRTHPIATSAQ